MAIPANPRNLVAVYEAANHLIRLTFTPGAGSSSTRIDRWDATTKLYTQVGTVPSGGGTFVDQNLVDGQMYAYRGLGINADGNPSFFSTPSNYVSVLATPDPVEAITAARNSNNSIGLNWTNKNSVLRPYTYHYVLRISSTQPSWDTLKSQINRIAGNLSYYLDSSTQPDHWYRYRVWTANGLGGAYYMSPITATVWTAPLAPTNVTARWSGNDIILSWTNPSATAAQFRIRHLGEGAGEWDEMATVGKVTTWRMPNAERGIDHRFQVLSLTPTNPDGNRVASAYTTSPWLAAQTTPNPPTIVGPGFTAASTSFTVQYLYNPLSPDSPEGAVKHQRRASGTTTWSAEVQGAVVSAYATGSMEVRMASRTSTSGWSDWSSPFLISIRSRPTLTINSPAGGSTITGPILPLAWTAPAQIQWEATVSDVLGEVHTATGTTEKAWRPSLEDSTSYTTNLRIHDGYLWSNWATVSNTTDFVEPAGVLLDVVVDLGLAAVELRAVVDPESSGPAPSIIEILRRVAGTSEWVSLGVVSPGSILKDPLPPLRTDLEYAALGLTDSGASTLSALADVYVDKQSYVINYGPGLGQVIEMSCDLEDAEENLTIESDLYHFAGRSWPVEIRGPALTRSVEAVGRPEGFKDMQAFNREWFNVITSEEKWFRDLSGLSFRASISGIRNTRGYFLSEVGFTAEQIEEE